MKSTDSRTLVAWLKIGTLCNYRMHLLSFISRATSLFPEQIKMLTGYTAKPQFLKKLTWICLNHSKEIRYIDTVRAFHFGTNYIVEVDIILPENMTVKEAHNIGEPLQQKLENISNVERAFVHLDYEFEHDPNTEHKVV
jgi:divalent metal cation (Fe/Co/Zn/Cd) transporter